MLVEPVLTSIGVSKEAPAPSPCSRRRLARFSCEFADNASGDELFDNDSPVGVVVNASGHDVLAVVPVDAHAKVLSLNGKAARPVALPWQEQDAS